MALALSLGSNVNATLPGVDVIIPKGQHVKVDLLAPEEAQTMENTIHPEFQLIKPDLEFSNMSIDFTMSPGLWFAFGRFSTSSSCPTHSSPSRLCLFD